ncbi:MAG TPA: sugar transferase, partial [Sphingobium sp.]
MSKIDLAIEGFPSRQPAAAAVQRNVRLWLCLLLLLADMAALATGFGIGLRAANVPPLSGEFWQPLAGGMVVYGVVAFHNQAYNPACLTRLTVSLRNAVMAFAGTLLIFLLVVFSLKATGHLSRLGISAGILCSGTLLVLQRLLIVHAVRRNFSDNLFAQLLIVDDGMIPHDVSGMTIVDAAASGIKADLDDPYMLHRLGTLLRDYDRVVISCPADRKADWAQMLKGGNILGEI